ncbi:FAD-binding oxidoreductase [bacterium]|nr:FAD-binding oxidoreductase [bacterium]
MKIFHSAKLHQFFSIFIIFIFLLLAHTIQAGPIINDITGLNPIEVNREIAPHSISEIQEAVKNWDGKISIGGGRFSMGGQTASENALFINMREFNKVISFDASQKTITVEPGITWHKIQEYIDPHNLSVRIMQTYSNFTVGGSISVNVHGRYMGEGPLVKSLQSIKVVLADGSLVSASPTENSELFYACAGGMGGMGVIVEATLGLADNVKVRREDKKMDTTAYKDFFFKNVRGNSDVIFHNGDIYPPHYNHVRAVSWKKTDENLTVTDRLIPQNDSYPMEKTFMWLVSKGNTGKWIRQYIVDPLYYAYTGHPVKWRNHEASYDAFELAPISGNDFSYVLQEYFVPVEKFDSFVPLMRAVFEKYDVNVVNVSIRHAYADPGALLAWARGETFAFVVYYKQGTSEENKAIVGKWTREMIDAVLTVDGRYYLPYQPHATEEQFHKAYPNASRFFELKKHYDPNYKFTNKLWDKYYHNL